MSIDDAPASDRGSFVAGYVAACKDINRGPLAWSSVVLAEPERSAALAWENSEWLPPTMEAVVEAEKPMPDPKVGTIYFLHDEKGMRVKIGWTGGAVRKRQRALETMLGHPLRLAATRSGTLRDERAMHEAFAEGRIAGEWFYAHHVLDFIA